LLLAAASGFTQYGYVYVEQSADEAASDNFEHARALRKRARRLYLRGYHYGLRGLEAGYRGFGEALEQDARAVLRRTRKQDVPLLYWSAAALVLAISSAKDDPEMLAQIPVVVALAGRVVELDESWDAGAAHEFLISLERIRVGAKPEEVRQKMKQHFERSLELSRGLRVFVSYAENAAVNSQNRTQFKELLDKALAVDPDARPDDRLANLVAQRRARWLLGRIDELFLEGAQGDLKGFKRRRCEMTLRNIIVTLILAALPRPVLSKEIQINLGTIAPDGSPWHQACRIWAIGGAKSQTAR
jgi:predicted anti-sigma-YlaC factor YlaD